MKMSQILTKHSKPNHGTSRLIVRDSYWYAASTMIGFIMLLTIPLFLYDNNTYATASSITVSIDDSTIDLNVAPTGQGAFSKSSASTIGVSTTNYTGYTLSITADSSSSNPTALINGSDHTKTLSSIGSALTEAQFKALDATSYNNQWGYLPSKYHSESNTSFLPSPSTEGDILDVTTTANSTVNEYELVLGARVDTTASLGAYSNVFLVEAVANATPYTITFVDNTVTSMPVDMSGTTDIDTVAIVNTVPQRNGYTFLGWCRGTVTNNTNGNDTCTGTIYNPNGGGTNLNVAIDQQAASNNITLYAMWSGNYTIDGVTYMQDFNTMPAEKKAKVLMSMVEGQRYSLKDNRDQETYYVAKLKDGNVWMLDNLRLGGSSTIALTPNDTNIQNNYTLPVSTTDFGTFVSPRIDASLKNNTNVTSYGQGSGKVGVYYNECAASAGTYCYADGAGVDIVNTIFDAPNDVCPAGWRRPTGGAVNNGEFKVLYEAYSHF